MDLSKASPHELAIELGKRSAGFGMSPTKTLAALVKAGLDKKTRAKVTKNEKELAALIRRATDSFWQHEAAIDWQNGPSRKSSERPTLRPSSRARLKAVTREGRDNGRDSIVGHRKAFFGQISRRRFSKTDHSHPWEGTPREKIQATHSTKTLVLLCKKTLDLFE